MDLQLHPDRPGLLSCPGIEATYGADGQSLLNGARRALRQVTAGVDWPTELEKLGRVKNAGRLRVIVSKGRRTLTLPRTGK